MQIPMDEQETTINLMRTDNYFTLYTSDITMIRKIDKMLAKKDCEWKLLKEEHLKETGEVVAKIYEAPLEALKLLPKKRTRTMSESSRNALKHRAQKMRDVLKDGGVNEN